MARAKLTEEEIEPALATVDGWQREATGGDRIVRKFELASFRNAQRFVNRICDLAEGANHHPDIEWTYNRVSVGFSTHDAGGLTKLDFRLAALVNELLAFDDNRTDG